MSLLFEPINLGGVALRNRVVMTSMHTGLEDKRQRLPDLARFYRERAEGGVGLIITGGFSPNWRGILYPGAGTARYWFSLKGHEQVTDAVHGAGGKIFLQLLHAGRYSYHPLAQSASASKAPINRFAAQAMSHRQVKSLINDYVISAKRAKKAGYDGVEIMGSEGYLLNQFLAKRTNQRTDEYGGSHENRMRLPLEVMAAVRKAMGADFGIIFRTSMLDLVEDGQTADEIIEFAKQIEAAGADALTTGIGWHEARIPTIITSVPRMAFAESSARVQAEVSIPVIASNRINMPEDAMALVDSGKAQMIGMARPFLADPDWVNKAKTTPQAINTCIACNQACLDHVFANKPVTCLVNPKAAREASWDVGAKPTPKTVLVIGAGPAGMAAAVEAASLGHSVRLVERKASLGGQFFLASQVPAKAEFRETLRYFKHRLDVEGVDVRTGVEANAEDVAWADKVIVSSGVRPRNYNDAIAHVNYDAVLAGTAEVGQKVAIIGGGGIAVDVAQHLIDHPASKEAWASNWGINPELAGGIQKPPKRQSARDITIFIRSAARLGQNLGKTSAWAHRAELKLAGVKVLQSAEIKAFSDGVVSYQDLYGVHEAPFDTVINCTGQVANSEVIDWLESLSADFSVVGGVADPTRLDAKRAIEEGMKAAHAV